MFWFKFFVIFFVRKRAAYCLTRTDTSMLYQNSSILKRIWINSYESDYYIHLLCLECDWFEGQCNIKILRKPWIQHNFIWEVFFIKWFKEIFNAFVYFEIYNIESYQSKRNTNISLLFHYIYILQKFFCHRQSIFNAIQYWRCILFNTNLFIAKHLLEI